MDNMGFLSGLCRSNIRTYDSSKRGTKDTIYIDYSNKNGYIWDSDNSSYTMVFNSATTNGLLFKGLFNNKNELNDFSKAVGDFWICENTDNFGAWYIWNGTDFSIINNNTNYAVNMIKSSQTLLLYDCIYLVDSSDGNITLELGSTSEENKGSHISVIKVSSDSNKVSINGIAMYDLNDSIELVSTGNDDYGWIIMSQSIEGYPKKYLELQGYTNNQHKGNSNYSILTDGVDLLIKRYENDVANTMAKIGQNIEASNYGLKSTSGKMTFKNANGEKMTLIEPSKDTYGVAVGNKDGRISLLNNGGLYNVEFTSSKETITINSKYNETRSGTYFIYEFKTSATRAYTDLTINLSKVNNGTRLRVAIEDLNGNILGENISIYDFNSAIILGGDSVVLGENTISMTDDFVLPPNYEFNLILQFSDVVTLCGSTTTLNDSYGERFIPTLSLITYTATVSKVVDNKNIKEIVESLTEDNRIDSKAIYNAIYTTTIDVTLTSKYVNNTIIFIHKSGTCTATINNDTFKDGDKITICSKYSDAKFVDEISDTTLSIKANDALTLQKCADGTWSILSKFVSEGYGNKVYYFASTTNDLTTAIIKSNIITYDYVTDWNIGNNTFKIDVDLIGDYYIYCVLPTEFSVDNSTFVATCVLNTNSYDIFVSTSTTNFTTTSQDVTISIQTDALAYNSNTPEENEILVGDGTKLGINGSGIKISEVALQTSLDTLSLTVSSNTTSISNLSEELDNKVNTSDIIKGICLAKQSGDQTISSNIDTLILFNTIDSTLSYNESKIGLTYASGLFTNGGTVPIVLSISYQTIHSDSITLYIKNGTTSIPLNSDYGCINMAVASGNSIGIYVNNRTESDITVSVNIQIINSSPM